MPEPLTMREAVADWEIHLRAEGKSPKTVEIYTSAARRLPRVEASAREVRAVLAGLMDRSPAYASLHYRAWQQWFRWLRSERLITTNPLESIRPPRVPVKPVPVLSDADLRRLLAACSGSEFTARRDAALIRLFVDTGCRASEILGLQPEALDLRTMSVLVLGKGRRPRIVPFGSKTAEALRRYLRARRSHRWSHLPDLWLSRYGRLTHSGLAQMLARRSVKAGLARVYPHQLRHSAAHRWLANGGGETDLMRLMGWSSREMLARYAASAADERARQAHRHAALGDRL